MSSGQRTASRVAEQPNEHRRPGAHQRDSYYGKPILNEPVWTWEIGAYFFAGGLAGASATLGLGADLSGNETLARAAWSAALAGVLASPPLLISDLGRPARFLNMLRMVKLTSPMSVGTWVLNASGAAFTTAFLRARTGRLPRLGLLASGVGGGVLGPALTTYTAVLLADTAVPIWHEARGQLPLVFAGSAIAAAGAAACILTPAEHAGPARRLALMGAVLEGGAVQAMERRLGELGRPYHEGSAGRLALAAKSLTATGAVLVKRFGAHRAGAAAGGVLLLAGSACERFAVLHAGRQSARDPAAVVSPQRQRRATSRPVRTPLSGG